jgi:hypothetical protein
MRNPSKLLAGVLVVSALALTAGCSSSSKSSPTTTTRKESGFQIETTDGHASVSLNGKLPEGWPADFPVPDDATVAGSGSVGGATSGTMVAVYRVSGDASQTYDFYKNNTAFHVTSSSSAGLGSAYVGSVQFEGAFNGSATLAGRNSSTYLAIVLKSAADVTTTTAPGGAVLPGGEDETTTVPEETTTTGIVS